MSGYSVSYRAIACPIMIRRLGVAILIGASVLLLLWYATLPNAETERHQSTLEQEIKKIQLPSGGVVRSISLRHRANHALVDEIVEGDFSYGDLRKHYDVVLASLGWRVRGEKTIREWGSNNGGQVRWYCKGPYEATLQYAGPSANHDW